MSAIKRQTAEKKDASRARAEKLKARGARGEKDGFSWGSVDEVAVHATIAAVTDAGDGIIISRTSDGGAGVITLLAGTDKVKIYVTNSDEAYHELKEIHDIYAE